MTINIKGYDVLIDDEDFERVSKNQWVLNSPKGKVYFRRTIRINGKHKSLKFHRFLMNVSDPKIDVDHINGDTLDNRKANLRLCSRRENIRNQKIKKTNTSGFKGVSWDKVNSKWVSHITINYRHFCLGRFPTPELAHEAYCEAAKTYHGEFANFG